MCAPSRRPADFTAAALLAILFALVVGLSPKGAASDPALPNSWEAHPLFVLRPDGDRNANFQTAGFDEGGDRVFVAQREPYRWSVWDVRDQRLVFEANDGRTDAILSRDRCVGLAMLPPQDGVVNSPDYDLTTFQCENGAPLKSVKIKAGVVRGSLVRIVQPGPCRLALLQFDVGTVVVDLDRGEFRSDLTRLFPKVDATVAPSIGCIAYALVAAPTMGVSTAYRIDLKTGRRQSIMQFPPIGNLRNPLLTETFEVSPNGQQAVMSVRRAEIKRKTTFGGSIRLELIDLRHHRWLRSLAESEMLIRGASWLDNDHILYVESGHHIAVLDAETGAQREIHLPDELVAANGGSLHFIVSSDKRRLMFHNLRAIYVYDLPR